MNNRECVPEPIAWATHHEPPMLFPTEEEAARYCGDDEHAIPLYALTTPAMLNGVDGLVATLTTIWSKSGNEENRKGQWWAGYDAGRRGCAIDLQSAVRSRVAVTDRPCLTGITDDAVELASKAMYEAVASGGANAVKVARAALTAAYPALMRDAERWRHARKLLTVYDIEDAQHAMSAFGGPLSEEERTRSDAAIDAAMQEEKP